MATGLCTCYRVIIIFEPNRSGSASLKTQNKTAFNLYFLLLKMSIQMLERRPVDVRKATGCVDSIFKAQCEILMTSLKFTTSCCIHCRIFISKSMLFLSI